MPWLRELSLEGNCFLNIVPIFEKYSFPYLEFLNLGGNKIKSEYDIGGLLLMKRLKCVVLYGNPIITDMPNGKEFLNEVKSHDGRTIELVVSSVDQQKLQASKIKYTDQKEVLDEQIKSSRDWKASR